MYDRTEQSRCKVGRGKDKEWKRDGGRGVYLWPYDLKTSIQEQVRHISTLQTLCRIFCTYSLHVLPDAVASTSMGASALSAALLSPGTCGVSGTVSEEGTESLLTAWGWSETLPDPVAAGRTCNTEESFRVLLMMSSISCKTLWPGTEVGRQPWDN